MTYTSDVERLIAAFESSDLLRPSAASPNLVDLARALAALTGVEGLAHTTASRNLIDVIGPAEHLVFILADGLGLNLVTAMPEGSFLPSHVVTELQTVFPSTTAVALTSLATGEWPSTHGVIGWWTHLPQLGEAVTILPFETRAGRIPLTQLGITPSCAFPAPSLLSRIRYDTLCLFPEAISDNVYSRYFSGGAMRRGYKTLHQAINMIIERVRAATVPTYTYLYMRQVDDTAHKYGMERPELRFTLLNFDRELRRLAAALSGQARIVVSADHGFLDAPRTAKHQINASHSLAATLRCPPSGDARVLYFHLRDSAAEQFREGFTKRFGDRFVLISPADAERLELFGPGPVPPETKGRLGDYIAISTGVDVMEYRPVSGVGRVMALASHHSGLSPAEMRIPLVVV